MISCGYAPRGEPCMATLRRHPNRAEPMSQCAGLNERDVRMDRASLKPMAESGPTDAVFLFDGPFHNKTVFVRWPHPPAVLVESVKRAPDGEPWDVYLYENRNGLFAFVRVESTADPAGSTWPWQWQSAITLDTNPKAILVEGTDRLLYEERDGRYHFVRALSPTEAVEALFNQESPDLPPQYA